MSDTKDLLFSLAVAQQNAYSIAYKLGYEAGKREASPVCPTCGGKGAVTETGVPYCGCE